MGDKWDRHPATDGFVFRADLPRMPAGPGAEDEGTGDRQHEGEGNSHGAPPRFSHDSNIAGLAAKLFGQESVHQGAFAGGMDHVCYYSAARSTVHTLAQMGPPILNVAAARGFGTCNSRSEERRVGKERRCRW